MRALGLMYVGQINSVPRKIDIAKGLSWLRRAADNSDGSAPYTLGMVHFLGGTAWRRTTRWRSNTSGGGADRVDPCMLPLAMCYADGVGVAADPAEAFKWTRIASEIPGRPDADACAQLAAMYDVGVGTPKDKRQAERRYRKAAEAGDERPNSASRSPTCGTTRPTRPRRGRKNRRVPSESGAPHRAGHVSAVAPAAPTRAPGILPRLHQPTPRYPRIRPRPDPVRSQRGLDQPVRRGHLLRLGRRPCGHRRARRVARR